MNHHSHSLIAKFKSLTDIYTSLHDAKIALHELEIAHEKQRRSAQELEHEAIQITQALANRLQPYKALFEHNEELQELLTAMIRTIESFQRYVAKQIKTPQKKAVRETEALTH